MPSSPFASFDARKKAQYQASRFCPTIHLLLDASGSMGTHAPALRACYRRYLDHLKTIAAPGTLLDQRCFTNTVQAAQPELLITAVPMPYEPGGGTRLYSAISAVISSAPDGDHLLVIFTDGLSDDEEYGQARLAAFWPAHPGWLPVFLGAFPDALSVGLALGIAEGNCLSFAARDLPEAFQRLADGTQRYLATDKPAARKQLAAAGLLR